VLKIPPHLKSSPGRGGNPFSPLVSTHRVTGWDEGIHTYAEPPFLPRGWGDLDFLSYFAKCAFCNRISLNLSGKKNWNGKN